MKKNKQYIDVEDVGPSEPLSSDNIQEISDFIKKEKIRLQQEGLIPEKVVRRRQEVSVLID